MEISFVSVIAAGSDPTAPIGGITCVIGGITSGWLTMQLDEFKDACEPYAAISPLMTQERIGCLSKKWERETLDGAIKELADLHKAQGVDTVIWDDDVVSRISAFAYLWTQTADRPALRRCEGNLYDFQACSLLALAGPSARLNMFNTKERWRKCEANIRKVLAAIDGQARPAPDLILPLPTVSTKYSNSSLLLPTAPSLKLPGQ